MYTYTRACIVHTGTTADQCDRKKRVLAHALLHRSPFLYRSFVSFSSPRSNRERPRALSSVRTSARDTLDLLPTLSRIAAIRSTHSALPQCCGLFGSTIQLAVLRHLTVPRYQARKQVARSATPMLFIRLRRPKSRVTAPAYLPICLPPRLPVCLRIDAPRCTLIYSTKHLFRFLSRRFDCPRDRVASLAPTRFIACRSRESRPESFLCRDRRFCSAFCLTFCIVQRATLIELPAEIPLPVLANFGR